MSALATLATRLLPRLVTSAANKRYDAVTVLQKRPVMDPATCVHAREEHLKWNKGALYELHRTDHFLVYGFEVGKSDIPDALKATLDKIFESIIRDAWYKSGQTAKTRIFHTFDTPFALNVSQKFKCASLNATEWVEAVPATVAAAGAKYLNTAIRSTLTTGSGDNLALRSPVDALNVYFPLGSGQSLDRKSHMSLSELGKAYNVPDSRKLSIRRFGEAGGPFELSRLLFLGAVANSIRVDIIGRASSKGSSAENKRLSEKRAKNVTDYLSSRAKNTYTFFQKYVNHLGEEQTIAPEKASEAERAIDRSVEIRVYQSLNYLDVATKDELVGPFKAFYVSAAAEVEKHVDAAQSAIRAGDKSKFPSIAGGLDDLGKPGVFVPLSVVWKAAEQHDFALQIGLAGLEFALHAPFSEVLAVDGLKVTSSQASAFSISKGLNGPFQVEDSNNYVTDMWPTGILFGLGSPVSGSVWRTPRHRVGRLQAAVSGVKKLSDSTHTAFPTNFWSSVFGGASTAIDENAARGAYDSRLVTITKYGEAASLMFGKLDASEYKASAADNAFDSSKTAQISTWGVTKDISAAYTLSNKAHITLNAPPASRKEHYFYASEMKSISKAAKANYFEAVAKLALNLERNRAAASIITTWASQWDHVRVSKKLGSAPLTVYIAHGGVRSWFWR